MATKPTAEELGIDIGAQAWQRSGDGDGAIEIAFVHDLAGALGERVAGRVDGPPGGWPDGWVLMRVAGDPAGRVLTYDRHEWECFLDGVKKGEFDDGAC